MGLSTHIMVHKYYYAATYTIHYLKKTSWLDPREGYKESKAVKCCDTLIRFDNEM